MEVKQASHVLVLVGTVLLLVPQDIMCTAQGSITQFEPAWVATQKTGGRP